VTTKRIGKSILEKTLTRWPVFVDHFNATVRYCRGGIGSPFQPDFIGTAFTKKHFNRSRL
ncbi:hypothetical protein, partial [Escherichia coli]|uniref:hypothetical protein n=1 Tax=Escherichia coli TaxID=562 RepID=UPI001BD65E62